MQMELLNASNSSDLENSLVALACETFTGMSKVQPRDSLDQSKVSEANLHQLVDGIADVESSVTYFRKTNPENIEESLSRTTPREANEFTHRMTITKNVQVIRPDHSLPESVPLSPPKIVTRPSDEAISFAGHEGFSVAPLLALEPESKAKLNLEHPNQIATEDQLRTIEIEEVNRRRCDSRFCDSPEKEKYFEQKESFSSGQQDGNPRIQKPDSVSQDCPSSVARPPNTFSALIAPSLSKALAREISEDQKNQIAGFSKAMLLSTSKINSAGNIEGSSMSVHTIKNGVQPLTTSIHSRHSQAGVSVTPISPKENIFKDSISSTGNINYSMSVSVGYPMGDFSAIRFPDSESVSVEEKLLKLSLQKSVAGERQLSNERLFGKHNGNLTAEGSFMLSFPRELEKDEVDNSNLRSSFQKEQGPFRFDEASKSGFKFTLGSPAGFVSLSQKNLSNLEFSSNSQTQPLRNQTNEQPSYQDEAREQFRIDRPSAEQFANDNQTSTLPVFPSSMMYQLIASQQDSTKLPTSFSELKLGNERLSLPSHSLTNLKQESQRSGWYSAYQASHLNAQEIENLESDEYQDMSKFRSSRRSVKKLRPVSTGSSIRVSSSISPFAHLSTFRKDHLTQCFIGGKDEMEGCTFHPKILRTESPQGYFEARNYEWVQKKNQKLSTLISAKHQKEQIELSEYFTPKLNQKSLKMAQGRAVSAGKMTVSHLMKVDQPTRENSPEELNSSSWKRELIDIDQLLRTYEKYSNKELRVR